MPHITQKNPLVSSLELHVYSVPPYHFGIHANDFPHQLSINGIHLKAPKKNSVLWSFNLPRKGRKGLLFHTGSLVDGVPLKFSSENKAYLLGGKPSDSCMLLFAGEKHHLKMAANQWHEISKVAKLVPSNWPDGIVEQVIRHRLLKIIILNENFLKNTLFNLS